ncbi:hypothetical protein ACHQM5_002669 [Ranunculus cassubicifolius]
MVQLLNIRPSLPLQTLNQSSRTKALSSTTFGNTSWTSLQAQVKCRGRITALFSNNNKQDQARKALENALGGKKSEFDKWNKEIQKREEIGGDAGGGGWFGRGGRWFGGFGGDHFWEEAQQASLVILVLMFVYVVIAKGEALLAVIFNPMLFGLRGLRNVFTYITSNISRRISPAGAGSNNAAADTATATQPLLSAKERVIRKWATD